MPPSTKCADCAHWMVVKLKTDELQDDYPFVILQGCAVLSDLHRVCSYDYCWGPNNVVECNQWQELLK